MKKKKLNKKLIKLDDAKPIKKLVLEVSSNNKWHPDFLLKKYKECYDMCVKQKSNKAWEEFAKEYGEGFYEMLSLDNRYFLRKAVDETMQLFAIQMSNELEEQFDVKTPSEKALVQIATQSFLHYLKSAGIMDSNTPPKYDSTTKYLTMLSKDMDRAYRRYTSAIQMLKQAKNPPIEINLKTNNAFISKNQQINHQQKNEINKA